MSDTMTPSGPDTLYGIPNCDQVKKARAWLAAHALAYAFCDYKKTAPTRALLTQWVSQTGWEILVNRKGSTWRTLQEARKTAIDNAEAAIDLMLELPSIIKRPVLVCGHRILIGFAPASYVAFHDHTT